MHNDYHLYNVNQTMTFPFHLVIASLDIGDYKSYWKCWRCRCSSIL